MNKYILGLCAMLSQTAFAQGLFDQKDLHPNHISYLADPNAAEREHAADITKMKVEVGFVPEQGLVKGKVTHSFTTIRKEIDTLFFDGPGITIKTALFDDKPVQFRTGKTGVTVLFDKSLKWDENHTITFEYEVKPEHGIYFIGWNQPVNKDPDISYIRKQIWTQGQGIDNRYWIPMYDNMNDKFLTEVMVTFDSKYKVLSNGRKLLEKKNADNTTTWHYAMEKPHAGYLLMLGIGNYQVKSTKTKNGTPVNFWYYPEFPNRLEPTSIYTEKMIEFLEDETGTSYAWGAYSQIMVQNFLYGAMENTSATVFGDFFTVDARGFKDRNYVNVNCHELTHQWFGDLITARSGNDVWLQESFATFYPTLFTGMMEGKDARKWMFRGQVNAALAQGEKDNFPIRHTQGGTVRLYPKGAAVLGMLRHQLGDDQFKRFIKYYLAQNGYKNVEAWDFQKAIKDRLGLNYDWFFDQWVHRGGEPHYKVSYAANGSSTDFTVEQIHKVDGNVRYFKMPVDFAVYYTDGTADRKTLMVLDSQKQQLSVPNTSGKTIAFALFDENSEVMKKLTFEKSFDELSRQLTMAPNMIDRYDALLAMASFPIEQKSQLLKQQYAKESFKALKAEIAKQLANGTDMAFYQGLVSEKETEVKNAFIQADTLVNEHKDIFSALLKDSAYSVVENALVKLMDSKQVSMEDKISYLEKTSLEVGMAKSIRCRWLEFSGNIDATNRAKYLLELTEYCGPNYEFRTRINAMNSLKRLNAFDNQIILNMAEAALSNNSRLAGPATDVLKFFNTSEQGKLAVNSTLGTHPGYLKLKEKGILQ